MIKEKKLRCCFCGNNCENEYGNNPQPANNQKGARCCDKCNRNIVIPARVYIYRLVKQVEK